MNKLLIRPGAIGDCILSFPALEYLKSTYTEVWVPSAVVPLVQFADSVRSIASTGLDMVGIVDAGMPDSVRERLRKFDSVVSWYGTNREEFRLALARAGVACHFHAALPPQIWTRHATDFFATQVGAPLGLAPRINVPVSHTRNAVVIHPFSGSARKNWPIEKFNELSRLLPYETDWVCGPHEDLSGSTQFDNLAELASWMRGARLYIGNDSGITHLAAASGCLTLALFGPTDPAGWAPRGPNVCIVRGNPLTNLAVEDVLAAANRLLEAP